jgi:hypothetical protein
VPTKTQDYIAPWSCTAFQVGFFHYHKLFAQNQSPGPFLIDMGQLTMAPAMDMLMR